MRTSIYAQALFATIPALVDLIFNTGIVVENEGRKDQVDPPSNTSRSGTTVFMTGCALLLSCIIEVKTTNRDLSVYHAIIVLNLSWLNCYCGLLSVLGSWYQSSHYDEASRWQRLKSTSTVAVLMIAHTVFAAGIGIWLWHDILGFSSQPECTAVTVISIIGKPVLVTNKGLRIFWLFVYSLLLYGVLIVSISGLVALYLTLKKWSTDKVEGTSKVDEGERIYTRERQIFGSLLLFLTVLLLVVIVLSTELTIRQNRDYVDYEAEAAWTFGQTLALTLAGVSGIGAVEDIWRGIHQWNTVKKRRRDGPSSESVESQETTSLDRSDGEGHSEQQPGKSNDLVISISFIHEHQIALLL